ncbi:hypothetical protein [Streptomyces sp. NPDC048639]|uniref:hypothetical protein n=1 Tax=Streptomyces sp. NPDC048639 TaxID=3365581 RepID=UPI003713C960
MYARRPLLTATAAGSLLCALWFVPSANATMDHGKAEAQTLTGTQNSSSAGSSESGPGLPGPGTARAQGSAADLDNLADTGSVDTTPYLVGGTLFLGFGAGMVAVAARRSRTTAI